MTSWVRIGGQVLYLDADDRERVLPHDGRGILTWYGPDGKESWAPPADDMRLTWDDEGKSWRLSVPADSPAAKLYGEVSNDAS